MNLALQDNTNLISYGWNCIVADEEEEEIISMKAGDVLLFRGDLVHAGAAYEDTNIRVHAYVDVNINGTVTRTRNQTTLVQMRLPPMPSSA